MNPGLTVILIAIISGSVLLFLIQRIRAKWEIRSEGQKNKSAADYAKEEVESLIIKVDETQPQDQPHKK